MSRNHRAESSADQDPQSARRLAMKRRAECVVAALVDAISAPIDAEELLALAAGEDPGDASAKAKTPTEQFETGLNAIRGAS